jgi:hypothetical protein
MPHDIKRLEPSLVLSAWIISYIFNLSQIASFKGQGVSLQAFPDEVPGKQIQLVSSEAFTFFSTLVQDLTFNTLMMFAIFDPRDIDLPLFISNVATIPLQALARNPFEAKISNLVAQAKEARASGDLVLAESLEKSTIRFERVSSNYLFPALKLLSLLAPALIIQETAQGGASLSDSIVLHASAIGLVATAVVGVLFKAYQNRHFLMNAARKLFSRKRTPAACNATLVAFRPRSPG